MKKIFTKLIVTAFFCMFLISCKTTSKNIIYADYISFGDNIKTNYESNYGKGSPYVIYDEETGKNQIFEITRALKKTKQEKNTAAIYAMDLGLKRIKYVQKKIFKKDPNTKYYVIFMTDGLDNISVQLAKNETGKNYKTPERYEDKIRKKIIKISKCNKKEKNDFNIYPIVFTGTDLGKMAEDNGLTAEQLKSFIDKKMDWMKGSSRGVVNAPEVIAANRYEEINKSFEEAFLTSGFEFAVPKGYVNKKIRMDLKGNTINDNNDTISTYFTAVLKNKGRKYYLTDINLYHGLNANKEVSKKEYKLMATNNQDAKATLAKFVLERPMIKQEGNPELQPYFIYTNKNDVVQSVSEDNMWIRNAEYDSQLKSMTNAYIQLIIDCSESLGDEFDGEIETGANIIKIIRTTAVGVEGKVKDNN